MASLAWVLNDILRARGGRQADWPLYRYRLSAADLEPLGRAVQSARDGDWAQVELAAAVALFAAHRLCREHREGHWRWETALGFEPTLAQREALLEALTAFWKRPLLYSGRGREVLWSLGREGGLPHHLLVDEGDRLGRVLHAAVRDRERLGAGVSTDELVGDHALRLSPRYRVEGMREVLVALVDALVALRKRVAGQADPIAALDRDRTGWRDELPLLFEGDHADRLVVGLLKVPLGRAAESPFAFEVRLVKLGDRYRVVRRITDLPSLMEATTLQAVFGNDLPHHGRLLATSERGRSFSLGELGRVGDGSRFRVRAAARPVDLPLFETLKLRLQGPHNQKFVPVGLVGSEGLSAEEPWVFSEAGDLLGTGSVLARDPVFFGVWLKGWHTTPVQQALGEVERLVGWPVGDLRVWRIEAPTEVLPPDEALPFALTPGAKGGVEVWQLEGRFEPLAVSGTVVLRGRPEVYKRVDDGIRERCSKGLEYARLHEPGEWDALDDSVYGEIWLRVRDGGRVAFRRRVLRVPDDFKVELKPNEVHLQSPTRALRLLAACERQDLEIEHQGKSGQVRVPKGSDAQSELRLRVGLQGVRDFEVDLPNPHFWAGFVGPGGVVADATVAVDRLLDLRAEVRSAGRYAALWLLKARAWHKERGSRVHRPSKQTVRLAELRELDGHRQVLSLAELESDIRLMLAEAEGLDAEVELSLEPIGSGPRPRNATLNVKQYSRVLHVEPHGGQARPVPAFIRLEEADDTPLEVRVRPIGDPAHQGYVAEHVGRGWIWPDEARHDGAWLLTATEKEASEVVPGARPRRVTIRDVAADPARSGSTPLTRAIAECRTERPAALRRVFELLANDAGHDDWFLMDEHLDTLHLWPATTYDVVVQLGKNQPALALATLRRARVGKLTGLPEAFETLPFAWWAVPAADWRKGFEHLGTWIDCLHRERHPEEPAWWLEQRVKACSVLKGVGGLLARIPAFLNPGPFERRTLREKLNEAHNHVLANASRQGWPGLGGDRGLNGLLEAVEMTRTRLENSLPPVERHHKVLERDQLNLNEMRAAPLIAAWITARGCAQSLNLEQLMALRRARAFDPEWFETAWGLAFPHYFAELESKR